jgi:hypothetical protein
MKNDFCAAQRSAAQRLWSNARICNPVSTSRAARQKFLANNTNGMVLDWSIGMV